MTEEMKLHTDNLEQLWHEGNKKAAATFLKRAVSPDMTLEELSQALNYTQVKSHLDEISFHDILPSAAAPQPAARSSTEKPQVAAPASNRRRRRGAEEMQALRDAILSRLQAAVGPVPTPHLVDVLNNGGHDVDLLQLGRVMTALETQGYISASGGRPKSWRLKPQGRTSPQPFLIRKQGAHETASA